MVCRLFGFALLVLCGWGVALAQEKFDPTANVLKHTSLVKVGKFDWPMWGGSPHRNNTPFGENIPDSWDLETGENVLWASPLGSQTYGNPVIANGKVFVGTNNSYGYLARYPKNVDLGCLLCFEEKTGKFLWQASSPKLPSGRVHDWPMQGICSTVYCEDSRLWYVTSRGEVVCLDVEGFHDGVNNGPFQAEPNTNKDEADIIWRLDMMGQLGVSQHNMCSCSVTAAGKYLFVDTGNGVDEAHLKIPAPNAPSHICLEKDTGKVVWTDNAPGTNVLHGQWSSPVYFEVEGQPQIAFGAGDGWIYSYDPAGDGQGGSKLLWKFDGNPKDSIYLLGGRATRNHFIGTPIFYDGYVYCAVGEDPEHGEGVGHLYCIDPTRRGDVSPTLVVTRRTRDPIPHRRLQAYIEWKPLFTVTPPKGADPQQALQKGELPAELKAEFAKQKIALPSHLQVALVSERKEAVKSGGKEVERVVEQTWHLTAKDGDYDLIWRVQLDPKDQSMKVSERTDELEIPNPNSAMVWHYDHFDADGDGKIEFEETMHRTIGSAAIKDDLLFIADFSGLVHCVDAKKLSSSGKPVVYWTHDMFAPSWGSPLIVDGKVYIGDEDGDITILELSRKKNVIAEINMINSIYSTPVVANNTLFISNKSTLFAIKQGAKLEGGFKPTTRNQESGDSE
jgi:hypothetical protein